MAAKKDHMRNRIWGCERDFDTHHHLSHDDEWMTDLEVTAHMTRVIQRKVVQESLRALYPAFNFQGASVNYGVGCIPEKATSWDRLGRRITLVEFSRASSGTLLRVLHGFTHLMRGESDYPVMHDGGFVSDYLGYIRRYYPGDADRRKERAAEFKQMLLDANVKTSMKSEATREAARYRAHLKKLPERRDELAAMIADLRAGS